MGKGCGHASCQCPTPLVWTWPPAAQGLRTQTGHGFPTPPLPPIWLHSPYSALPGCPCRLSPAISCHLSDSWLSLLGAADLHLDLLSVSLVPGVLFPMNQLPTAFAYFSVGSSCLFCMDLYELLLHGRVRSFVICHHCSQFFVYPVSPSTDFLISNLMLSNLDLFSSMPCSRKPTRDPQYKTSSSVSCLKYIGDISLLSF